MKRQQKILIFSSLVLIGVIGVIILSQLPPNWLKPSYLVNLSSVLTLISFTVRSILLLRLLAIGAQITFIPYCLMQSTPLWAPVVWNSLFLAVNLVNVILLLLEQRPVKFTPDEEKLYNLAFRDISRREFLKLTKLGDWKEGEKGEVLVSANEPNTRISILSHGEAIVLDNDRQLNKLSEGTLLGLPSVLVGEPMPATIKLNSPARYLCWQIERLRKFLDKQPELRTKLTDIVSRDLAKIILKIENAQLQEWRKTNDAQSVLERINQDAETLGLPIRNQYSDEDLPAKED
jgi:CRP-like cAMP-binding protein